MAAVSKKLSVVLKSLWKNFFLKIILAKKKVQKILLLQKFFRSRQEAKSLYFRTDISPQVRDEQRVG